MMAASLGTVLVGGGTGFVGSAVSKHLQKLGYTVIIASRNSGANKITWNDIKSNGLPDDVLAVINLAGQNILDPFKRWNEDFKENVWSSRIETTNCLREAIEKSETKPRVFITASGVGYYAPSNSVEYDEDSTGGDFDYLSKLCTEWEAASHLPSDHGVRTVNVRLGVVLGRHGGMIQQLFLPFYLGLGGPTGCGSQPLPWIHIHDASALFAHAVENDSLSGPVNGVAPQIITNAAFATAFGKALWRPAFFPMPTFALNAIFTEERAKIMTEGQKVIPKKALESGFTFRFPDIESAANEFAKLIYKED